MFIPAYHSRFENMTQKLSKTIKFLGHDVLSDELVLDNKHSLPHNVVFQSSILNVYHKRVMDTKLNIHVLLIKIIHDQREITLSDLFMQFEIKHFSLNYLLWIVVCTIPLSLCVFRPPSIYGL